MNPCIFYSAGQTEAMSHCVHYLQRKGCSFAAAPCREVTHLLLDVPFKNPELLPKLLEQLSDDAVIFGGNLQVPGYKTIDLLQDPLYLAENANITAHGAVKLALAHLPVTLQNLPVLVIGWGRIGKCLAYLLRQMGASVTVAARKETDRAMLFALGYSAAEPSVSDSRYRVVFNTVPALIPAMFSEDCLKIELASVPGLAGDNIINGRALPNRCAPESSGQLIARSVLRHV